MNVKEAVLKRRSVREFSDKPISDEIIQTLLESAMAAPSACNKRPWEFFVVKDKEVQEQLKKALPYANYNSPLMIIVAADDKRSLGHRVNDFWIQDCSAAVENILLSAVENDLGTCWCGIFPMVTLVKRVRTILKVEENVIPMALIHIGYGVEKGEPRSQYEQKRVHII